MCVCGPSPLPVSPSPAAADDFKMVVVEAIRALCLKFPAKHRSLMNFLSNILREEGGFEYKKSIVNAILALIQVRAPVLARRHGWQHSTVVAGGADPRGCRPKTHVSLLSVSRQLRSP